MVRREDVQFSSGGERISAWLYHPDADPDAGDPDAGQGAPVVVMAHGLGAVRTMRLDAYAERFAAAGYACLVFDYRHFGDSQGEPRQLLDIRSELQDWVAAVRYVRSAPGVDPDRIALWGTSFSGGHVIAVAAHLPGIAAVIAQCPFTDGIASARAVSPLTLGRLGALAVRDLIAARRGRPPLMVPVAARPGEVALMTTPDALPGYLALAPEGVPVRNEVAARFGLPVLTYRPGRLAAKVDCPILFCICEYDSVAPAGATRRHAARAPRGRLILYPEGHFDIYHGDAFERAVADQIAFLDRQLKRRMVGS